MLVILAHKWAEGLTFGISFLKSELSNCQINTFLIIFSMMGPFGVLFGIFLSAMTNKFIQGIFLAASSGTFLYIACSEVITEQFEKKIIELLNSFVFLLEEFSLLFWLILNNIFCFFFFFIILVFFNYY